MKLATVTDHKQSYSVVVLEDVQDVADYRAIDEQIKSRQAVGFWMGFKTNGFHADPLNYAAHQLESGNTVGLLMANCLGLSESPVSMLDYCQKADSIFNDMYKSMAEFVQDKRWGLVSVNRLGGYCPINKKDLQQYTDIIELNEQELYNYLLSGETEFEMKITSATIVIENDRRIPSGLIQQYCGLTSTSPESLQVITSFKLKTILFEEKDWITFFMNGIKNGGLTNIVFRTTGQDFIQISGIKRVFEYIMNLFPDKTLNLFIKAYAKDRDMFTTDAKNINITFLD